MNKWFIIAVLIAWPLTANALSIEHPLPDPTQEARAQNVFRELRCIVCQSESIADSPAKIASDMRNEVRAAIAGGKTDADILTYFVSRYGNAVLMRTPFNSATWFLWLAPWLILFGGGMLAWRFFRKK